MKSSSKNVFFSSIWKQIIRSNDDDDVEETKEKDNSIIIPTTTTSNQQDILSKPRTTKKKGIRVRERQAVWTKEAVAESVKVSLGLLNPPMRPFLNIKNEITTATQISSSLVKTISNDDDDTVSKVTVVDTLRILQLNMLADGLSGLRDDLGAFSRISEVDMIWDNRKQALLKEVLQYNPDVITLQECDHFYDWFLPLLTDQGYEGVFAPKPASACLEVSDNSDGCAIFVRRSKFQIKSVEVCHFVILLLLLLSYNTFNLYIYVCM
jgi:hypothetical protein